MTAEDPAAAPRRRGPRRADAPGTGPASADAPEPRLPGLTDDGVTRAAGGPASPRTDATGSGRRAATPPPAEPAGERDRWLREQRPPHWG